MEARWVKPVNGETEEAHNTMDFVIPFEKSASHWGNYLL